MISGTERGSGDQSDFKFNTNMPQPNFSESTHVSEEVTTGPVVAKELHDPNLEQEDEVANLQRVMRDLRYADMLDTARTKSESMTVSEQRQITNSLERRKWGGILRNLQKGDTVVSILSSTSDLLSIKNLNDNIFGSQTTDGIIAKRRQLTESIFKRVLSVAGVSAEDLNHVSLEQNYKFGTFKVPRKYNIDVVTIANQACAEVDLEMKKFIIKLADEEQAKAPNKTALLQNFRGAVNTEGYKMTFGAATVELDELEDVILAVNGSLQTARAVTSDKLTEYGDKFSSEKMTAKIEQINDLRNSIYQGGNQIIGSNGNVYEVFSGNVGSLVLNKDLLREVRKDKFIAQDGQEQILKDLKNYIKGLNIFDAVKPFTADEVGILKDEIIKMNDIAKGVLKGEQSECAEAADMLDKNEKDPSFTSEARFHAEAVKIKNCAYLSLDVLDVGVDQLLDFENRTQMVATKKMTFAQASLAAGDAMTKKLRDVRAKAYSICEETGLTHNNRMNGLVGGDELTLAIDLDAEDADGKKIFNGDDKALNNLIHRLKKETSNEDGAGVRVVKTVIAESRRHSSSDNIVERMKEHLTALKNAEEGTNQAKQIENELRKLNKFIQLHPGNESAEALSNSLKDFVIAEVDDHFAIRTELEPDMSLEELLKKIKSFYN